MFSQNNDNASLISEQHVLTKFCMNRFEVFFFSDDCRNIFSICPVIPHKNVILT